MISIIVPIYKAEEYLSRCIDSILHQTYTDFELLLIDDGSPDGCGAICDAYAAKDSRVRVFHKENGGVSSARNLGLDNVQGEWITFVDSDDWLELNYLESLSCNVDANFIIGGVHVCSSLMSLKFKDMKYKGELLVDFINKNKGYRLNSPWGSLLNRCIINEHKLRFDERIRFAEDAIFNMQYLCYCDTVRTISNCGYNYWDYDISSNASIKYNLSIDEICYTLSIIVALNNKLSDILGGPISSDADYAMMLGMVSIEKRCDDQIGEQFYMMCKGLGLISDKINFFNNEFCSPIFQGIARLKSLYENESNDEINHLFEILHLYIIKQLPSSRNKNVKEGNCLRGDEIRFRCKDFYLWYILIRGNRFKLFDYLMKLYVFLFK